MSLEDRAAAPFPIRRLALEDRAASPFPIRRLTLEDRAAAPVPSKSLSRGLEEEPEGVLYSLMIPKVMMIPPTVMKIPVIPCKRTPPTNPGMGLLTRRVGCRTFRGRKAWGISLVFFLIHQTVSAILSFNFLICKNLDAPRIIFVIAIA